MHLICMNMVLSCNHNQLGRKRGKNCFLFLEIKGSIKRYVKREREKEREIDLINQALRNTYIFSLLFSFFRNSEEKSPLPQCYRCRNILHVYCQRLVKIFQWSGRREKEEGREKEAFRSAKRNRSGTARRGVSQRMPPKIKLFITWTF